MASIPGTYIYIYVKWSIAKFIQISDSHAVNRDIIALYFKIFIIFHRQESIQLLTCSYIPYHRCWTYKTLTGGMGTMHFVVNNTQPIKISYLPSIETSTRDLQSNVSSGLNFGTCSAAGEHLNH